MNSRPITLTLRQGIKPAPTAQLHFDGTLTLLTDPSREPITAVTMNMLFRAAAETSWHVLELEVTGASDTETAIIKNVLAVWPKTQDLSVCFKP